MWGEKNIRVIKTQWFDIIYAEGSAESASILSQHADSIYYEIADLYGRQPQVRMPVVLTPNNERLNAYFSTGPYNRIVIYDTGVTGELAVFSNNLLSLFRHELTHAYTYNMKNGLWRAVGNVFGDAIAPSIFTVSGGMAEGATMTSEASSGEGRLNSEFSMHMVKQAKIEEKFPAFSDVQGASTVYPYGSFYFFNGAFHQWLQKKYGYEKYAQWWYRLVNLKSVTSAGAFKKVYGIKLKKAWKQFQEEYPVPQIDKNPFSTGFVTDYFDRTPSFSSENLAGPLYDCLSVSDQGNLWIEKKESAVFYKGKKLFTLANIDSAKVSADGRFISVTWYDTGTPNYSRKIKIYDTVTKDITTVDWSGYADATVICKNDRYFLVSLGFSSIKKWIDVKEILVSENGRNIKVKGVQKIDMELNTSPCYFTDLRSSDGNFAYIKKAGQVYSLVIANLINNQIQEYSLPYEKMILRDLSFSSSTGELLFSWTKPGTMPRLGKMNPEKGEFVLFENDISGGIFNPVRQNDGTILYTGHFYRSNRLLVLDDSKLTACFKGTVEKEDYIYALPDTKVQTLRELEKSQKYSGINYLDGLFLPYSSVSIQSLDPLRENTSSYWIPLGLTYQGSDPWGGLSYGLSAGVSFWTGLSGAKFSLGGGTDTSLYKWNADAEVDFYHTQVTQFYGTLTNSFRIPLDFHSRIGLSDVLSAGYVNDSKMMFIKSNADLYFANGFYSGPGPLEYEGFSLGTEWFISQYIYRTPENYFPRNLYMSEEILSPYLNIYIPKLIPINCRESFAYNLPVQLSVNYSISSENRRETLSANSNIVLFYQDVQKAVPLLNFLFFQNYYFSSGYSAYWGGENYNFDFNADLAYLSGNVCLSFSGSSSMAVTLYSDLIYYFRGCPKGEKRFSVSPGIKTHF